MSRLPGQLLLLALAVIAPAAVLAGSVVDVGPDGLPRATAVHLGLAIADPIVLESACNSLVAAGLGTFLALGLGTSLGHGLGRWSFWGRKPLAVLTDLGLAVSPLVASLGCRGIVDACAGLTADPADRVAIGGWGSAIGWVLAVGLAGAPWVALAVRDALGDVDLTRIEAAQQRGMRPRQAFRRLIWPLIRPSSALAAAGVFARAIGDPGPPLILGLRRSLAFQIYESLRIPEGPPRASVLGALVLAMAVVGSALLRWWGGTDWLARPDDGGQPPSGPVSRGPWAGPRIVGLLAGGLLVLSPLIGLGLVGLRTFERPTVVDPSVWSDPETIGLLVRAAVEAGTIGLLLVVLAGWCLPGPAHLAGPRPKTLARALIAIGPAPVVVGVAILQTDGPAWLLGLGWRWPWGPTGLDLALPLATLLVLLPVVVAWWDTPPVAPSDAASQRSRLEAATLLGLPASRARRLARAITPRSIALPGGILAAAMAATTVSTILLGNQTTTPTTLSTAIVREAERPSSPIGPILPAVAVAVALSGLAVASRSRPARLGQLARRGIGPV